MIYTFYLFLIVIWCGFSGDFSWLNILFGSIISAFVYRITGEHIIKQEKSQFNLLAFFILIGFTLKELVKSSLLVAWDVLTPSDKSQPSVETVKIRCELDVEKFFLTNLISITPGTIFIDFAEDEQHILVHSMFSKEDHDTVHFITNVLEPKVLRVFGHA